MADKPSTPPGLRPTLPPGRSSLRNAWPTSSVWRSWSLHGPRRWASLPTSDTAGYGRSGCTTPCAMLRPSTWRRGHPPRRGLPICAMVPRAPRAPRLRAKSTGVSSTRCGITRSALQSGTWWDGLSTAAIIWSQAESGTRSTGLSWPLDSRVTQGECCAKWLAKESPVW